MLDHFKTLYFIGLGLVGAKDITVKGLEIEDYGRKLILADGDMADELLKESEVSEVEFLVVGDPFVDMVLREVNAGIQCRVIHNASMNAVECCGLQNFGETVSIVFWTDTWRPETFYDEIKKNRDLGMHTLCLIGECYNFFEVINTNRFTKWKISTTPDIQQDLMTDSTTPNAHTPSQNELSGYLKVLHKDSLRQFHPGPCVSSTHRPTNSYPYRC
uniref:Diphthine methyl ester synthase n=1 Tax=Oncorhynchus tshawytscha TaxID=74940 RepID=A0A8C8HAC8_ONCTS